MAHPRVDEQSLLVARSFSFVLPPPQSRQRDPRPWLSSPFLDTASSHYPRDRRRSGGGFRVPRPGMRDRHRKEDCPRGCGVYPSADGHGASSAASLLPCIRPGLVRCLDHRTVRQNNHLGRRERVVCDVFHPPPIIDVLASTAASSIPTGGDGSLGPIVR